MTRAGAANALFLGVAIAACGNFLGLDDEPVDAPRDEQPDATVVADAAEDAKTTNTVDGGTEANAPLCEASDCEHAVFVTSGVFPGSALELFDSHCQAAADDSPRPRIKGRVFKAWISTSTKPAKDRHVHSALRYFKVTAADELKEVAPSWSGLVSGVLSSPIDLTETGADVVDPVVWTGTNPDGDAHSATCQDWKGGNGGRAGKATEQDIRWTTDSTPDCATSHHIYCIEQ